MTYKKKVKKLNITYFAIRVTEKELSEKINWSNKAKIILLGYIQSGLSIDYSTFWFLFFILNHYFTKFLKYH